MNKSFWYLRMKLFIKLSRLPSYPPDKVPSKLKKVPGIYLAHDPNLKCVLNRIRIGIEIYPVVYVGESENMHKRINIEHLKGNIKGSNFRKYIGEALEKKLRKPISENEITNIIKNYRFKVIIIQEDKDKRKKLEEALIYFFANHQICYSEDKLLRKYAGRKLWNKDIPNAPTDPDDFCKFYEELKQSLNEVIKYIDSTKQIQ